MTISVKTGKTQPTRLAAVEHTVGIAYGCGHELVTKVTNSRNLVIVDAKPRDRGCRMTGRGPGRRPAGVSGHPGRHMHPRGPTFPGPCPLQRVRPGFARLIRAWRLFGGTPVHRIDRQALFHHDNRGKPRIARRICPDMSRWGKRPRACSARVCAMWEEPARVRLAGGPEPGMTGHAKTSRDSFYGGNDHDHVISGCGRREWPPQVTYRSGAC
jgi:hypothetical protein